MSETVIVVHGGAWAVPDHLAEASRRGVTQAAITGHQVLQGGGTALEAVIASVKVLEDDPAFDAGRGSVLTHSGQVEMDAMVMDGANLDTGAVAGVSNVRNPVELARLVMERTDHTLLVSHGAEKLAEEEKLEKVGHDYLVTDAGREEWETYKQYNKAVSSLFSNRAANGGHDTVGAVALDKNGHLACATSTGGITGKRPGRVGDSPLVGCGGYADDSAGAVSTTGHGESITKVVLAHTVITGLSRGLEPGEAGAEALDKMFTRVGGSGGVIIIDKEGRYSANFSTERMPWAAVKGGSMEHGFLPGECIVEKL